MSKTGLVDQTRRCLGRGAVAAVLFAAATQLFGCDGQSADRLTSPSVIVAPYDPSRGEVLWAVVPLRNESGTSIVNVGAMSDKLVNAAEEVRGIRCVPLNRTIQAMQA